MNKKLIQQIKQLKNLELAGQPQDSWIASNKELLMNQVQPQVSSRVASKSLFGNNFYYAKFLSEYFGSRVLRPVGVFCMVALAFLGYNAVSTVATASIPGDALYPVKTASENMQLSLAFADGKKMELQLNFLSRRTDELQQIAKQTDSSTSKQNKITKTVKKITSDVNTVKASMAKISMASVSTDVVAMAKQIDDKTLKIEQDIVNVHASLPEDVKKGVAQDVKEAIATTEDAGANALSVIVKSVTSGDSASNQELTIRVTERIKTAGTSIQAASDEVNKITTSTLAIIPAGAAATGELMTTSSIAEIKELPKQAQEAIDQAKTLLDQKDYNSALQKIQESKDIVVDVIGKTPIIVVGVSTTSTTTVATGTPSVAK
jgi:uncharacterized protein (UPF0297 family)